MPHIDLHNDRPGIVGLFQFRQETARPLMELTEVLLRGPGPLSRGERELIAAYVSSLNGCRFCTLTHVEKATAQLADPRQADVIFTGVDGAACPPKLGALLHLAGAVQRGGCAVTPDLVTAAKEAGASDLEIHDTVLIAAAFCMYNRYVDGLAAVTPDDPAVYARMADFVIERGYTAGLEPPEAQRLGSPVEV